MRENKTIAVIASVVLIFLSGLAAFPGTRYYSTTYRVSFLFLGGLLWTVYALRGSLHLRPLHFSLFVVALLIHDMGVFGAYRKEFFNLEFDTYVHFYFGFAGGLILYRSFQINFGLTGWSLACAVTVFILGIGAIHELIEFASTLLLGPEKGMLKLNDPDKFDTQKDLLNNMLGTIVAVVCSYLGSRAVGDLSREEDDSG